MLPRVPIHDCKDTSVRNPVLSSKCSRAELQVIEYEGSSYLSNLFWCQLRAVALFPSHVGALFNCVADIVSPRAKKHMVRVAASRVVSSRAVVADLDVVGNRTSEKDPDQPVNRVGLPLVAATAAVSFDVVTEPSPATIGMSFLDNLLPKTFRIPRLVGITRFPTEVPATESGWRHVERLATSPAFSICGKGVRWFRNCFRHIVVLSCDLFRALGEFKLPESSDSIHYPIPFSSYD